MHYRKWTKVVLSVVFEEFDIVYFFSTFFFSRLLSIGKSSTLAKIWGGCSPPSPLGFYGPADINSK